MLQQEFDKEIFAHVHKSGKELNALVKKYKLARNEDKKLAYRDEILYNVSKLIKRAICANPAIQKDEVDDVFNSTVISLYECLEHYKPNNNNGFVTYFYFWIKKTIVDHCYARNIVHIVRGAYSEKSKSKIQAERVSNGALVQLDRPIHYMDGTKSTLHEVVTSNENPEETLYKDLEEESLVNLMKRNLNPTEFVILKYRYFNDESWTLYDFQPLLKVGHERIRQIESRAIWKLRKILTNQPVFIYSTSKYDDLEVPSDEEFEAHNLKVIEEHAKKSVSGRVLDSRRVGKFVFKKRKNSIKKY